MPYQFDNRDVNAANGPELTGASGESRAAGASRAAEGLRSRTCFGRAEALIVGFFQGKSIGRPGFVPVKMKWLLQDPIDSNGIRFVGTSLHL